MDGEWRGRLFLDERKVRDYLLDLDHPAGGSKARFFIAIGFMRNDHGALCEALLVHGRLQPLIEVTVVRGSRRYRIEGVLSAPRATGKTVRTIWSDEGNAVRLVTAYPIERSGR